MDFQLTPLLTHAFAAFSLAIVGGLHCAAIAAASSARCS